MKKYFFTIIVILITIQHGFTQNTIVGLIGELSLNDFRETENIEINVFGGYGIGIFFEERMGNWGYYNEIGYLKKGGRNTFNNDSEITIDSKFAHFKLIMNRYFNFEKDENQSIYLGLGVYFGPRIKHKETVKINGTIFEHTEEIAKTKTDAGLIINIGFSVDKVRIEGRSAIGLMNAFDDELKDFRAYHTEIFSVNIGYILN